MHNQPSHPEVAALLARSHRLGADRTFTNFAGGNTSAKAAATDPVTGESTELLWTKGSGGDLGTLEESGLAVLRLDRLRGLVNVYPGPEREDEMVAAFDYCRWGLGGAAPSIDTAMHGLVTAAHVDHLHAESGLAFATAADGEALTRQCFGDRVLWVPWRRPGFQLGLDIAALHDANPQAIGLILGGHGITAWGATAAECEAHSVEIITTARDFLAAHGKPEPFGPHLPQHLPLPEPERQALAAQLLPVVRGLVSGTRPQAAHFSDDPVVLDFLARAELPRLAALGTSCPDHFLRTKVKPLILDRSPAEPLEALIARLRELHADYRAEYEAYYARHATPDSPPMRGADPAIVLLPGIGMISLGGDRATARVSGEYYLNAINAMRGAESVSTYAPIPEAEKFRVEYWSLEEAKLRRAPAPAAFTGRVALLLGIDGTLADEVTPALEADGATVVAAADAVFPAALAAGGLDVVVLGAEAPSVAAEEAINFLTAQGIGGDLVIVTGGSGHDPARPALLARADELRTHGIRVNHVYAAGAPFRGDEQRAATVARAVIGLTGGELTGTTGVSLPVFPTVGSAASGKRGHNPPRPRTTHRKLAALRDEVLQANLAIPRHGLAKLTWGNVSGIDRDEGIFLIKPSGIAYTDLTADLLVAVDLSGHVVAGELNPSVDTATHACLYQAFPSISGITHTHSTYAVAFAQARSDIPVLGTTHADVFNGPVPCSVPLTAAQCAEGYEWNTGQALVDALARAGADPEEMPAALACAHGPFTWAASPAESVQRTVVLETLAEMAAHTLRLNPSVPEPAAWLLDRHYRRKHGATAYYGNRPAGAGESARVGP
ncbi:MAG: short-chain dehydrogenase [Actinomycetia bacterium]|nr:short-chain dehydrogenase [Actinomycetes bacterium]